MTVPTEDIGWRIGTAAMILNLSLCLLFAVVTGLANKQLQEHNKSSSAPQVQNKRAFMAYWIYTFAALCAIQCFLCHYSMLWYKESAVTYCRWGAPVCVVLFFAAKSCLYGFFLERAKLAQGLLGIFPDWFLNYALPIYIFLYWLIWCICIMTLFEGAPNDKVTSCVMETYVSWLLLAGGIVDVFNTILFLFLFLYPLYKMHTMNATAFANNPAKKAAFISMMWFNVIGSSICTISSFIYLFVLPVIYGYLWFAGQIDMMVNSTAVFFMLATNRRYLRTFCNEYCDCLYCDWCCCNDYKIVNNKKYEMVTKSSSVMNVKININPSGDKFDPSTCGAREKETKCDENTETSTY
eukprot:CAMPEP_0202686874 /NCGR_PEP_ID=MMETSP1385-20130828/2638_1 /ASSEMBLY_ACC=CAM_ASM_000861 /TAXON_ID=933848 /ORGANISM="Elphidium margaritaceum" /LENGTH=351 /DNA_ID=CAMNT_0049341543 /DNA_START=6 /DNA_END=1061 /DNA_ORIENTATION=+